MGKNLFGGKKGKRQKNNNKDDVVQRKIELKHEDQEYGKVIAELGCCKFSVLCQDGITRIGHLRGGLKKKTRITMDDIILVDLRAFETNNNNCDICFKYTYNEIIILKKNNYINFDIEKKEDENEINDDDDVFEFSEI